MQKEQSDNLYIHCTMVTQSKMLMKILFTCIKMTLHFY